MKVVRIINCMESHIKCMGFFIHANRKDLEVRMKSKDMPAFQNLAYLVAGWHIYFTGISIKTSWFIFLFPQHLQALQL